MASLRPSSRYWAAIPNITAAPRYSASSGHVKLPAPLTLTYTRPSTGQNSLCRPSYTSSTGHGIRRFHLGSALEGGVQAAQQTLLTIHTITGLPWYLVIPLFALGVNLTLRLPLQIYSRKFVLKRVGMEHLAAAWYRLHATRRFTPEEAASFGKKSIKRLERERGIRPWKLWSPTLSIAPWLLVTDATRRMTGAGGGIVSLISGGYIQEPKVPADPALPATAEQPLSSSSTASDTSLVSASATKPDIAPLEDPSALAGVHYYEPSMVNGGALWFPDLTLPDPYVILPMAWTMTLCWALIPKSAAERRDLFNLASDQNKDKTTIKPSSAPWGMRIRRGLLLASVAMPMVAMNLPSGMMLYVVSSAVWAQVNGWMLERFMPPENPLKPPQMAYEKGWVKPVDEKAGK